MMNAKQISIDARRRPSSGGYATDTTVFIALSESEQRGVIQRFPPTPFPPFLPFPLTNSCTYIKGECINGSIKEPLLPLRSDPGKIVNFTVRIITFLSQFASARLPSPPPQRGKLKTSDRKTFLEKEYRGKISPVPRLNRNQHRSCKFFLFLFWEEGLRYPLVSCLGFDVEGQG